MENRDWMYTGHASRSTEWVTKTSAFLEHAFGAATKGSSWMLCPCSICGNNKRKHKKAVGEDFTSTDSLKTIPAECTMEAAQAREAQRSAEIARFFGSLNILGMVVPPSLLNPYVPPPPHNPTGTPVSIYIWLFIALTSSVVLTTSLLLHAGAIAGFGDDPSGWPFATVRVALWRPSSSAVLRVAWRSSSAWVLRVVSWSRCAAALVVRSSIGQLFARVGVVGARCNRRVARVGARWELFRHRGRR